MSVYIPPSNTGDYATESWAQSRFATKTALLNTDSNVTNNTSAINSLNSSRSDLVSRVTTSKVNIGPTTKTNQGLSTIAIGEQAGTTNQGANSIAIGTGAGSSSQLSAAIAIGNGAGASSQASDSIALGNGAGGSSLGATTIAIGKNAATSNAAATSNNIILNATGLALNTAVSNATYIAPIRADTSKSNVLCYDTTSGEVVADDAIKSNITNLQSSVSSNTSNITSLQTTTTSLTNRVADTIVKVGINSGIAAYSNSVSIGNTAGGSAGANSVSIGQASRSWGDNSICIGQNAKSSVGDKSICLNATGSDLITTVSGFHVAPVRNNNGQNNNILTYNTTTNEIGYVNNGTFNTQLKTTYTNNSFGWDNIQVDAAPSSGSAYVRANRPVSASGEVGFAWANAGANQWINFIPSGDTKLAWYNQTGGMVMKLDLNGNFEITGTAAKPSSTTWLISSDERIKEDIQIADVDICYNTVKNLKLKRFKWKDEYMPDLVDRNNVGWIAQEFREYFPKSVFTSNKQFYTDKADLKKYVEVEDFLSIDCDQVYKTMYGAIQKLIEKVETLETECADLRSECADLRAAVAVLSNN